MKRLLVICLLVAIGFSGCVAKVDKGALMVQDGKTVKFDYTLTVDGKVADTSVGKAPFEYIHGQGKIVPGLEKQMQGMKIGEAKTVLVLAKDAYGEVNPNAVQEVPKTQLPPNTEIKVGQTLLAKDNQGRTFPLVVSEVRKDSVMVDLNHPLAGKDLNFDIKIVDIK